MNLLKFFLISILVTGCASTPPSVTQEDVASKAAALLGNKYLVFYVPARGLAFDAEFIALSKTVGPSEMATRLARIISEASDTEVKVAVGGPRSAKTSVVIQDAINLNSEKTLNMLHLVFVGDATEAQKTGRIVESVRAQYDFVSTGL